MSINTKLVDAARSEWTRWGFSVAPLHKPKKIGGVEGDNPFSSFVHEYWVAVGRPERNGHTPLPWSAAFISFCFAAAGAGKAFPGSEGHFHYCAAILKGMAKPNPAITLEDPSTTDIKVGDLVWAGRSGEGCVRPPRSFTEAMSALKDPRNFFCSHADLVVSLRDGEADVIGGNVSDSVTQTTYVTTNGKISDPRHTWLAVIRNTI
jgi:hypothetical protein